MTIHGTAERFSGFVNAVAPGLALFAAAPLQTGPSVVDYVVGPVAAVGPHAVAVARPPGELPRTRRTAWAFERAPWLAIPYSNLTYQALALLVLSASALQ